MMGDPSSEKVTRNNAAFRDANDEIAAVAADQGLDDGRQVPFICECSDPGCSKVISLSLVEYRRVRSNPRHFVHAPGHEEEVDGAVRLVEQHTRYVVIEKVGRAGEIAETLARDRTEG